MTKEQAENLYSLVNSPQWRVFVEFQQAELERLRQVNDWIAPDKLQHNQGMIEQIKRTIELQKRVSSFLGE